MPENASPDGSRSDGSSRPDSSCPPRDAARPRGSLRSEASLRTGDSLEGPAKIYVIDFDGASLPPHLSPAQRFSNLARLDRSYLKVLGERGPLSHAERRDLLAVYCGGDAELHRDLTARIPAHNRSLALHRLHWRPPSR